HRHARHRDVRRGAVVARGQRQAEQPRRFLCILVEQLEEIANAEEDESIRVARFRLAPLLHQRGFVGLRHRCREVGTLLPRDAGRIRPGPRSGNRFRACILPRLHPRECRRPRRLRCTTRETTQPMLARAAVRTTALATAAYVGLKLLQRRRAIDLRGRSVLITGGSRGLGLLLAREFSRRGCRVAICARSEPELETARRDLAARGAEVLATVCDVSDRDRVQDMVDRVSDRFGRIDILVNNAGIIQVGPMATMTWEDYEQALAVSFWGSVNCTLAVLPQMRVRREGRIVNIPSSGAKIAIPHLLPYSAAKFALRGFSEGARAELAKDGIVVTTIVPGLMWTGSPVNAL